MSKRNLTREKRSFTKNDRSFIKENLIADLTIEIENGLGDKGTITIDPKTATLTSQVLPTGVTINSIEKVRTPFNVDEDLR